MNRRFRIFVFVIVLLGVMSLQLSLASPTVLSDGDLGTVTKADRYMKLNMYGLVYVNDTFNLLNNGTSEMGYLSYYLPKGYERFLKHISAYSLNETGEVELEIEKVYHEDNVEFKIILTTPLGINDTLEVKVLSVFSDILSSKVSGTSQEFNLTFPELPLLSMGFERAKVTIETPDESDIVSSSILDYVIQTDNLAWREFENVPPMSYQNLSLVYHYSGSPILEESDLHREVYPVPEAGYVKVSERHEIMNRGPFSLTTVYLLYPKDAKVVSVSDEMGSLSYDTKYYNSLYGLIRVNCRIEVSNGSSYRIFLTYDIPIDEYYEGGLLENSISIRLPPSFMIVRSESIEVKLPPGSPVSRYGSNSKFQVNVFYSKDHTVVIASGSNVTYYDSQYVSISYTPNFIYYLWRPLLYSSLIASLCAVYVISKGIRRGVREAEVVEVIPKEKISKFCDLYENKVSVIMELEKLDDMLRRRKIKKREYNAKVSLYNEKLKGIDKSIKSMREELLKEYPRIGEMIKNIELYEEQWESARTSLKLLERRYYTKKISKDIYERLKDEQEKKLRESIENIDRIIFDLREFTK
ncbi:MAG: hypothetical protein ACTSYT_04965 [Candidatus Asgardarchaeia archaeon]